ncbi:MAG TPA: hypothetical protein VGU68_00225, partial [Ktedonobacteraceae bacterium]|nr:hypothetical protein [Ktedonobacteraceae bacterium]
MTGSLVVHPAEAPYFRPAYQPYQPPAPQRPVPQPGQGNGYPQQTGYQAGNGYQQTGYPPTPYAPYAGYPPYNGPIGSNGYPQAPYPAYPQQYYNYPAYG